MPELPEVETTRRGLLPHVAGHRLRHADTLAEVDPAELATVFQSVPVPA